MGSTDMHDRSLGDLTRQFSQDAARLVRSEVDLAKAELAAKARGFVVGGALVGAGAVLFLVVLGGLAAAGMLALHLVVSAWLSALIVSVAVGVVGAILVLVGLKSIRRSTPPVPTATVESVKEDVAWAKTQAKSGIR